MVMTLQEISDRFEIIDLLTSYCVAIDKKDIDSLDRVFSQDARIDFSRAGGPHADLGTIKRFLKENLGDPLFCAPFLTARSEPRVAPE
jgi:hypothetical protein